MITSLVNMKSNTATKISKLNIVSKKPEWKILCDECSSVAKKAGWTKEDSRKLLKEVREKNNL